MIPQHTIEEKTHNLFNTKDYLEDLLCIHWICYTCGN